MKSIFTNLNWCWLTMLLLVLAGCFHSSDSDNEKGNPLQGEPDENGVIEHPDGSISQIMPITLLNGQIVVPVQEESEIVSYCDGNNIPQHDTLSYTPAGLDTMDYVIEGNKLILVTELEELESGALVEHTVTYTRQGSGSGIIGTWTAPVIDFEVVEGTPTAEELDFLEFEASFAELFSALMATATFTISATEAVTHIPASMANMMEISFSEDFMDYWEFDGGAAGSAITAAVVDDNTGTLTGGTTGEVVTISQDDEGNRTYTSSNSAHADHVYYQELVQCPNTSQPDWFDSFLSENGYDGFFFFKKSVRQKIRARLKLFR